jgi:hypothetical protein
MQTQNLTRTEVQNIKNSFKDPKFHSLLGDYMMEISNPNNVEEQNQYMRQLLKEGQLPKGSELLTPQQAFMVCSKLGARGDRRFSQKLFINICGHDKIDKPDNTPEKNGGNRWKVPYRVGKLRLSQCGNSLPKKETLNSSDDTLKENKNTSNVPDSKKEEKDSVKPEIVSIIEIVFNSETIIMSGLFPPFKKMVCDIALDAVGKVVEQKDQFVDKDYQVKEADQTETMGLILIGGNVPEKQEPSNLKDKPDLYYELMDKQEKAKNQKKNDLEFKENKESLIKKVEDDVDDDIALDLKEEPDTKR